MTTVLPPVPGDYEPIDPPAPARAPSASDLEQLGDLDRNSRVGRTAVQVGVPAAVVAIATWAARLAGLDLDPGAGVDMPAEIVAAFISLATAGLSWRMNRSPQ